ncbi:restriction endonuclease subunit S [Methanobrevibacter woesei]|uniref:restriction endonuclease subunit S n=1 Tax=Methanobrevibacter woesei TaxID=190976 RepID=UPI0023F405F8|nr:restriction endonuclease subunit S [Methanobrevibacter woesei]
MPNLRFNEFHKNWFKYKIKEIGTVKTGKTPSTANKSYFNNGNIIWVTPGDISNKKFVNESSRYLTEEGLKKSIKLPKNAILVTCIGATIGKICMINKKGSCNQQINAIIPNEKYNPHFIYYVIEKNSPKFKLYAGNTATPIINKKFFENLSFYFPSINEQNKIGKFLSLIDKKIELMERKHKLIKKYKNGLMREIFTQNIKFSNNELGLFKLGEIVELMRNGSNEVQVNFETEFPVTRIETISKGNINFDKVGFVETIDKSYQLKKGDILLSNINSLKYIGNCVYFDMDKILYHGMNLMLIRFKENFNKKFLYYYIKYHKNWFQRMACQAVNQASINQTSLKKFPFIIPKLKTDQDKIADFLSEMDNKIDFVEQQLEKIKEFKKYLLQQMFI